MTNKTNSIVENMISTSRTGEPGQVFMPDGRKISWFPVPGTWTEERKTWKKKLTIFALLFLAAFVAGSMSGCDGAPIDLPSCETNESTTIDTQTCVDEQNVAICRFNTPKKEYVFDCVTSTKSSSGDDAGIECVKSCPTNHYTNKSP